ncbi:MAG: hypothetical protein ACYS7Y_04405 [Planctomycetota bacterium]
MRCSWNWICGRYKYSALVPGEKPGGMHEVLGAVKQRGDGRWTWWRWRSRYHSKKWTHAPAEGVEMTQELATAKVEKGWQ